MGVVRQTKQRSAIHCSIRSAEGPLSIAQIHERAGEEIPGLGIATVYRAVKALREGGEIVAVELDHPERSMGEISILAVDPDHQGGGIGTALTEFALDRLKDAGMTVAMVDTGGDPGHAAARRTYEKAGYVQLPIARYFKNL